VSNLHPTVRLTDRDGEPVDIDADLAELISELWRQNIATVACCQDVGERMADLSGNWSHVLPVIERERGRAHVDFRSHGDLFAFLNAVANAGPRDAFYVRMVHFAAPGAWTITAPITDYSAQDDLPTRSDFDFDGSGGVSFPRTDLDEILRRLRIHAAGQSPPPGPIDWSSVEISDEEAAHPALRR
jgi:hypothetical protein